MASKNPATRRRQRQRRKERAKQAKREKGQRYYVGVAQRYSPYEEDRFFYRSCTVKNRYPTEEAAIHACIVGAAERGARLTWYKCGLCDGWHITSRV